jgi:dipeptidase D
MLNMTVRELEPKELWNNFEDLNAVPRPSKKEERVISFMINFGESLGLEVIRDKCGNVVIKKPGMNGGENKPTLVLQSHLDMVHQKNAETVFDFDKEGIRSYIDGDWVTAEGTTLGADNGMGAASMMTVLASKDINHPPLEALFTIDEETGMTGAFELDPSMITGRTLLNIDTEDDDELSIGCAGGIDVNASWTYSQNSPSLSSSYKITVKGLKGGHSGMDIILGRGNANKVLARVLHKISFNSDIEIASFDGGSLRNAIPREANTVFSCSVSFKEEFDSIVKDLKEELRLVEPDMQIILEDYDSDNKVMNNDDSHKFIKTIHAVFNGVFRMSNAIPGLVETSSSLARVLVEEGKGMAQMLCRSSVESGKMNVAYTVGYAFENINAELEYTGSYPGWTPNRDSKVLTLMENKYEEMFNEKPEVKACHAGLECGILGEHFNGEMDMISFGPTIKNPHSPDEKVNIKSVQKFWNFYIEVLKSI